MSTWRSDALQDLLLEVVDVGEEQRAVETDDGDVLADLQIVPGGIPVGTIGVFGQQGDIGFHVP